MNLPSTSHFVNSCAGLGRPLRFRNRLAEWQHRESVHPDIFRVVQFRDARTGDTLKTNYGLDIFAVIIENQKDSRPKAMKLLNVDPHGGEKDVENYCDARGDLILDDPSRIEGQCDIFYFGGGDARRYYDASGDITFNSDDETALKRPPSCARLQMVDFLTGWTQPGRESNGWRGFEMTANYVHNRTQNGDRLFLAHAGHNSEVGRNYLYIGSQHDPFSRSPFVRSGASAIHQMLTHHFGLNWSNGVYDDSSVKQLPGVPGAFPMYSNDIRRAGGWRNYPVSDMEFVARLFDDQPPMIMTAYEFANTRIVANEHLDDSMRWNLVDRVWQNSNDMRLKEIEIAKRSIESKIQGPFSRQLHWRAGAIDDEYGDFEDFVIYDPADDATAAFYRAVTTNFWIRRELATSHAVLLDRLPHWDQEAANEALYIDTVDLNRASIRLMHEGLHVVQVHPSESAALQTAAIEIGFRWAMGRDVTHELDDVDPAFRRQIMRNQSDTPWNCVDLTGSPELTHSFTR